MWRFIFGLFLVIVFAIIIGFIASLSGKIVISPGTSGFSSLLPGVITVSLSAALLLIVFLFIIFVFLWKFFAFILRTPRHIMESVSIRREKKGRKALSHGIIAIGAGDRSKATYYASRATRFLKDEPLTYLLNAQAAQISGDLSGMEKHFQAMLEVNEMEVLAHRGLFNRKHHNGDMVGARMHAEAALELHPRLSWALNALLSIHTLSGEWERAKYIVSEQYHGKHITKDVFCQRRAALLTAQAQKAIEQSLLSRQPENPESGNENITSNDDSYRALKLARQAHKLDPSLVPATHIIARILTAQGSWRRASWALKKTWKLCPHPDLADAYAHLHPGDSPTQRLERVMQLVATDSSALEGDIAIAKYAIAARNWEDARQILKPHIGEDIPSPIARICILMGEIERGENEDEGRAREWFSRATYAPQGPCWVGENEISEHWRVASPTTGIPGVFTWRTAPQAHISLTQMKPKEMSEDTSLPPPIHFSSSDIK